MRALIVDDERLARARLARLLGAHDDVEIAGEAGDGEQALSLLTELEVDVVFLDIRMPGLDGIAVARALPSPPPHVVFVTAYDQHAVDAFEADAVDYLLKPVATERLAQALDRIRKLEAPTAVALAEALVRAMSSDDVPRVIARQGERIYPVDAREVSRFYSSNKYTIFHLEDRTLFLDDSLNELEARLAPHGFVRVHRSELVNLSHIRSIATVDDTLVVELKDGQSAKVSRRMVKDLKSKLGF